MPMDDELWSCGCTGEDVYGAGHRGCEVAALEAENQRQRAALVTARDAEHWEIAVSIIGHVLDAVPAAETGSGEVWTQAELDEIRRRARERAAEYQQYCD